MLATIWTDYEDRWVALEVGGVRAFLEDLPTICEPNTGDEYGRLCALASLEGAGLKVEFKMAPSSRWLGETCLSVPTTIRLSGNCRETP